MGPWLRSLLTEDDGDSVPDIVRIQWVVLSAVAILCLLAMPVSAVAAVFTGHALDYMAYGGGLGAALGGLAALMLAFGSALAQKVKSGA